MSYSSVAKNTKANFIKQRFIALNHAANGIRHCFMHEIHFRLQSVIGVVVLVVGLWLGLNQMEWFIIATCILLVLVLEVVNTAIEHLCNAVTTDYHPRIKLAKDVAAGAVLLAAMGSCIAGFFIFVPKIISLLT